MTSFPIIVAAVELVWVLSTALDGNRLSISIPIDLDWRSNEIICEGTLELDGAKITNVNWLGPEVTITHGNRGSNLNMKFRGAYRGPLITKELQLKSIDGGWITAMLGSDAEIGKIGVRGHIHLCSAEDWTKLRTMEIKLNGELR